MEEECGSKQSNVFAEIQKTKDLLGDLNEAISRLGENLQPVTIERPSGKTKEEASKERSKCQMEKMIWENNEVLEGQICLIRELKEALEI